MLKSKVFMKKTRKGKILKIVREHYLRDDIWSGSPHIPLPDDVEHREQKSSLEATPTSRSSICPFPHYIMPDTNVFLHQVRPVGFGSRCPDWGGGGLALRRGCRF